MSNDVKRYKVEELNCCFNADMIESPNGEYVEYADYARLKAESDWRPISTFDRQTYVETLFVYRDELLIGVGYKVGDDCDGRPMFKVAGGLEDPIYWMPIKLPPAK